MLRGLRCSKVFRFCVTHITFTHYFASYSYFYIPPFLFPRIDDELDELDELDEFDELDELDKLDELDEFDESTMIIASEVAPTFVFSKPCGLQYVSCAHHRSKLL